MTTALEVPVTVDADADAPRHTRCCEPAVKHGLCRTGKPMTEVPVVGVGFECDECERLWTGGHFASCPRDSGFW